MASPHNNNSNNRHSRTGAMGRRLFLHLIPKLDLYQEMLRLLYHYAMGLWHHHRGARYQDQRLLRVCSVEKGLGPNAVGLSLSVIEGIRMGPLSDIIYFSLRPSIGR